MAIALISLGITLAGMYFKIDQMVSFGCGMFIGQGIAEIIKIFKD
jgi:hypothetical protein